MKSLRVSRNSNTLVMMFTQLLALALEIVSALPAAAQPPVPDNRVAAIGGWIGAALPAGDGLDNGAHIAATLDVYLTPRVSVQGEVGVSSIGADRRGLRNDLGAPFFTANLVYNWKRGVWHPYITGGLGLYRYTSTFSAQGLLDLTLRNELIALGLDPTTVTIKGSDNKLGGNFGGGIEYFLSRRLTIVGDFRYHGLGNIAAITPIAITPPFQGSFFNASVGLKRSF